jgi:hypothetical protein
LCPEVHHPLDILFRIIMLQRLQRLAALTPPLPYHASPIIGVDAALGSGTSNTLLLFNWGVGLNECPPFSDHVSPYSAASRLPSASSCQVLFFL